MALKLDKLIYKYLLPIGDQIFLWHFKNTQHESLFIDSFEILNIIQSIFDYYTKGTLSFHNIYISSDKAYINIPNNMPEYKIKYTELQIKANGRKEYSINIIEKNNMKNLYMKYINHELIEEFCYDVLFQKITSKDLSIFRDDLCFVGIM